LQDPAAAPAKKEDPKKKEAAGKDHGKEGKQEKKAARDAKRDLDNAQGDTEQGKCAKLATQWLEAKAARNYESGLQKGEKKDTSGEMPAEYFPEVIPTPLSTVPAW